jgi:hypothetical protein
MFFEPDDMWVPDGPEPLPENQIKEYKWKPKDGDYIHYWDMTTAHLRNVINKFGLDYVPVEMRVELYLRERTKARRQKQ